MHLIIGGDGGLGKVLRTRLAGEQWKATTRREINPDWYWAGNESPIPWIGAIPLDLSKPIGELPAADFVYIVAAVTKIVECERNQVETWVINADAPVEIGRRYAATKGTFVIFVSSDAVEFMGQSAYGRQKAYVESFMLTIGAAVVRPSRIEPDSRVALAEFMIDVAMNRRSGLHRWR